MGAQLGKRNPPAARRHDKTRLSHRLRERRGVSFPAWRLDHGLTGCYHQVIDFLPTTRPEPTQHRCQTPQPYGRDLTEMLELL